MFVSRRTRAPRGHTRSADVSVSSSTSPCSTPAKKLNADGSDGVRSTTRRSVPCPVGGAGSTHQRGLRVRAVVGDVVEELRARLGMSVRLRELHDRAVRFARHQERFFPLRIRHVDVHRMEARAAHARDRVGEVGDLERHVMRPGAVPGDEAREEVVLLDCPTVRAARRACRRRRGSRATPASGESRSPDRRTGWCRRARP